MEEEESSSALSEELNLSFLTLVQLLFSLRPVLGHCCAGDPQRLYPLMEQDIYYKLLTNSNIMLSYYSVTCNVEHTGVVSDVAAVLSGFFISLG